jgi:site-specific DNA-cytosine methylase
MKMFDLYSGIGGFILAASWCRYIVISGYHETDPYCRKVLCENFPLLKRYQHPKEIREKIDLLTATVKRDANGKTNWQTIYKVIKLTRPTWIVIEGNARSLSVDIDRLSSNLACQEYREVSFILPACAVGTPQRSDRLWIVAQSSQGRRAFHKHRKDNESSQDAKWRFKEIYQEWHNRKYESWQTYSPQDWFNLNTRIVGEYARIPDGMDKAVRIPNRKERTTALVDAVIPQMAYPILAIISELWSEG